MAELPKTEQELQDLIDAKVTEAVDKLNAKHNGEMATMRQKHDAELKKAKEQANLSAEEIAQQKIKEQQDADQKELTELRAFKKSSLLGDKLAKAGLPSYFKNDTRLLNAEDGDIDKVIKDVKREYDDSLPKGATHSTVVTTPSGNQQPSGDAKQQAFDQMGNVLKEVIG